VQYPVRDRCGLITVSKKEGRKEGKEKRGKGRCCSLRTAPWGEEENDKKRRISFLKKGGGRKGEERRGPGLLLNLSFVYRGRKKKEERNGRRLSPFSTWTKKEDLSDRANFSVLLKSGSRSPGRKKRKGLQEGEEGTDNRIMDRKKKKGINS